MLLKAWPPEPQPSEAIPVASGPGVKRGSGPVIILDDDVNVARTVAAALCVVGHKTVVTTSAVEFFDLIDRLSPSHLVIDLFMPEMDGLAVLRGLAGRNSPRIIVTSGHDLRLLESMRQSAIVLGLDVVGRLEKPFRLARLRELMAIPAREPATPYLPSGPSRDDLTIHRIRAALEGGEFKLYLQSKVSCRDRKVIGYEALVRWDHPVHGIITPAHFVPQIEAAGLEFRLAHYMIDMAMAFLAGSDDAGLQIAVNVSLETFRLPIFRTILAGLRTQHGVSPDRIILELTDSGTGELCGSDIEAMTRIRLDGYLLALDDFGVGHASIQRLVQLPFPEVKIDGVFIRDLTTSEEARKLVISIVSMGQALGIQITAEGIEDDETFEMLQKVGCSSVQGYLFSRPFPAPMAGTARYHDPKAM